ncbi:MAG: pilus assembly protein TadD, partial [Saprospiraceae bacterium]|nr:pilus assembly protein TadD [Saprospiraceae bacterium]
MNDLRFLVLGALLLLFLVLAGQCRTDHPSSASDYLNLEPGVAYVGMETCRSCHPNVYQSFIQTGMGRSFGPGNRQKSAATTEAHALVYDEQKNFYYHPFFRDSQLYILEFRLENGDTVHRRLERVDYIVGSGQHTNSHIVDFGGYIYQAPITFYTQD